MNCWRLAVTTITVFPVLSYAANPFLNALNDQPLSAKFHGAEWSEDTGEVPLTARAVTTRIAKMQWGAIFKIEFTDLKSGAGKQRAIRPQDFVVTENRIILLNEEDNEMAVRKISATDNRRNPNRLTFTGSPAAASNIKKERGKRQSN
jgi:hypothetical protein